MHINKKKIFIISLVSLITTFGIFFDKIMNQSTLLMAIYQEDMTMYRGSSQLLERYNESLFESKKWNYDAAWALISPLLSEKITNNKEDIYELAGDISYKLRKEGTGAIRYYELALEYGGDNIRIEKKIQLLRELWNIWPQTVSGEEVWDSSGVTNSEKSQLWEMQKDLLKLQEERWTVLDYHASNESYEERIIRESISRITGESEKKEW